VRQSHNVFSEPELVTEPKPKETNTEEPKPEQYSILSQEQNQDSR
jgi:hypothetical protein